MSRAIVNVSVNGYHGTGGSYYIKMQSRLVITIREKGYVGALELWTDKYPKGSPTHQEVSHQFKVFAMKEAEERGHRTMLWLDSPFVAVKDPALVLEHIEREGYLVWYHPPGQWTVGAWSTDAAIKAYEISRSEAFDIPLCCSGAFGWSIDHPTGRALRDEFLKAPDIAFVGAVDNKRGQVSKDRRIMGHRHDQTVLSIIAHKLKLKFSNTPDLIGGGPHISDTTVFAHDPRREMMP